jgi:endogenous inhibitor of DNA gyrase (YacG/DUF329 family)
MPKPDPRCPVCRKPAVPEHAPFCSEACRNRDLIAWLDERYVVPGRPAGEDDETG